MLFASLLFILFAMIAPIWWLVRGRDKEIIETVELYPPNGMTPAEVAYLLDGDLEDEEMMFMIFYLADKGYISIESEENGFILRKAKAIPETEPDYLQSFKDYLFQRDAKEVHTENPSLLFREHLEAAKEKIRDACDKNYGQVFTKKSENRRWLCMALMCIELWIVCLHDVKFMDSYMALAPMAVLDFGCFFAWNGFDNYKLNKKRGTIKIISGTLLIFLTLIGWAALMKYLFTGAYLIIFLASEAILFFFSLIMQKRTDESRALLGKLYGFRTFIKEAELDRIKALMDDDPEYFFHILPYAGVLGLETQWTKHFAGIAMGNPKWEGKQSNENEKRDSKWYSRMAKSCTKGLLSKKGVNK